MHGETDEGWHEQDEALGEVFTGGARRHMHPADVPMPVWERGLVLTIYGTAFYSKEALAEHLRMQSIDEEKYSNG